MENFNKILFESNLELLSY